MTINNVAISGTETFQTWVTKTNQLIVVTNLFTDGISNANILSANSANAKVLFTGSVNVGPTIVAAFSGVNSSFSAANSGFTQANTANTRAFQTVLKAGDTMSGNLVMNVANINFPSGNTGITFGGNTSISSPFPNTISISTSGVERIRITNDGITNTSSLIAATGMIGGVNVSTAIVAAFLAANSAFGTFNASSSGASTTAAFSAANSAFLAANSAFATINASSTGSSFSAANNAFLAANSAFAAVNVNASSITTVNANVVASFLAANSAFAKANTYDAAFLAANSAFASSNTLASTVTSAFLAANSAFASGNTNALTITSSFSAANAAALAASSAFGAGNVTATSIGSAFSAANSAFASGNTYPAIISAAFLAANSGFAKANSCVLKAGDTISGDLQISTSLGVGTSGSGVAGAIRATNDITSFFSDERLKTRIHNIIDPLVMIKQLDGFYYIANKLAEGYGYDGQKIEVGLSAQQLEKVLPEVVTLAPFDSEFSEGKLTSISGENYLTIHYERVIPLLVESIKSLIDKIEDLESRIDDLEDC